MRVAALRSTTSWRRISDDGVTLLHNMIWVSPYFVAKGVPLFRLNLVATLQNSSVHPVRALANLTSSNKIIISIVLEDDMSA